MKVSRSGYLTMRQAAEWLGMGADRAAARRLTRLLEAMERRDGRRLILREGSGRGTVLRVTKIVLRDYMPEHFSQRERVVGVLREQLNEIRAELRRGRVERKVTGKIIARIIHELGLKRVLDEEPK